MRTSPIDLSEHPEAAELFAYWDGKRAGRRAPARADIDPVDIPRLLPNMFIFEVTRDPLDYRVALYGTALVEAFGTDFTNLTFDEVLSGPNAAEIRREYDRVVETFEPAFSTHKADWTGRDFVGYSRLLLPLSDDGETVDKLLGAAFFDHPET